MLMAKTNTIITIGRQFGSGGKRVAQKLSEELDIPLYDEELLDRAAKDSGMCQEIFEKFDEAPNRSFLYSLVTDSHMMGFSTNTMVDEEPMEQRVFDAQSEAIKEIADEGPCILVGRCADYILRDRDDVLSIFIHARMAARANRVAQYNNLTIKDAEDLCNKNDKRKANYYNYYTNKTWGEAKSYMICLDTSLLGIDGTVETILKIIEIKDSVKRENAGYALDL